MRADIPRKALVFVGLLSDQEPDSAAIAFLQRFREQEVKLEIVAVGFTGACSEEAILAALARGADRAIRIDPAAVDPRAASLLLAEIARKEKPDLVLLGNTDLSEPASQIGPRIASILGWPHVGGVYDLEITEKKCEVVRAIDSLYEQIVMGLPAVLGIKPAETQPPLLSLYEIVAARTRPIKRVKASSLGSVSPPGFTVLKSEPAANRRKGRMVANVDELVVALRNEAHVI
ncbi:MAG TPA: hypothetical protein VFW40_07490 [Capsulimonadaceae bacterium]|nr:hypothetical protein [Capsulimonadaceae bacterium]